MKLFQVLIATPVYMPHSNKLHQTKQKTVNDNYKTMACLKHFAQPLSIEKKPHTFWLFRSNSSNASPFHYSK